MPVKTIEWKDGKARIIDQTRLPGELVFLDIDDYQDMAEAIKRLSIRGAPAIGIAAAYGTVVGLQHSAAGSPEAFRKEAEEVITVLAGTRPTAVNLFWALERMKKVITGNMDRPVGEIKDLLLEEAHTILKDDTVICRNMGAYGAALIPDGSTILTHCNAGGLATGEFGTALAVMYMAAEQGKTYTVYADETRPLLQGARLTSWELEQAGIDVTLICDNMAGFVMKQGRIDAVVVGADRVAANGDAANKIGTYSVAVLAKKHDIPFYVVAPTSTFDLSIASGTQIPIEERSPDELRFSYGTRIAPENVGVYNPAFDVTDAELITALVTEKGVIENPDTEAVKKVVEV